MKKAVLLFLLCLNVCWSYSQHITEQEALDRALQYMSTSMNTGMRAPSRGGGAKPESAPVEAGSIYAFNLDGGGYIIASADSRTLPVLGYSTTGSIDWENMPDNMRSWLRQYDQALGTLGSRTDFKDGNALNYAGLLMTASNQDRKPVEPLIKTHWYQDAPYWDQAPLYNGDDPELKGKRCVSGCIATAMAQIMNYYKWPKTVPDGIPSYDYETTYNGIDKVLHMDALPPVTFDWDNTLDDYSNDGGNDTQRQAVATLMKYCGWSVEMVYTPDVSGAYPNKVSTAFLNYFGYTSAQYLSRIQFSIDWWEDLIYEELAAGRPVCYGGYTEEYGHAFICDGYDTNGLFHINWGWGGKDDGYFALSVLNPYNSTSAAYGSSGIGFSIDQDAIVHISPTEKLEPVYQEPYLETFQLTNLSVNNTNTIKFQFYYTPRTVGITTFDYALGSIDNNGNLNPVFIGNPRDSIIQDLNKIYVAIDTTLFQPGDSLVLYPMFRLRKPAEEWRVIPPLDIHLVAGCSQNGLFYIRLYGMESLECIDGSITKGTGRLGERSDVTVIVRNQNDMDYINRIYLTPLYYGHINKDTLSSSTPFKTGEKMSSGAYIRANDTGQVTFSFVPRQGGLVRFLLSDDAYYPGTFDLELDNDTLVNYESYLENNSWVSHVGDEWFYNIEFRDKPGVNMPYWIPSDSICLKGRFFRNHVRLETFFVRDEIREYLKDLPLKGGKGNYLFNWQVPINISSDGLYYVDSYLGNLVDGLLLEDNTDHIYEFNVNYTDVLNPPATATDEPYYDLLGRPIEGISERKGFYIKGNRTVFIK